MEDETKQKALNDNNYDKINELASRLASRVIDDCKKSKEVGTGKVETLEEIEKEFDDIFSNLMGYENLSEETKAKREVLLKNLEEELDKIVFGFAKQLDQLIESVIDSDDEEILRVEDFHYLIYKSIIKIIVNNASSNT